MSKTYISAQLRRKISDRANHCCEYCLHPELLSFSPHAIDHVIAEKHGGTTTEDNLALACKLYNTFKGSDIASIDPETNQITPLFNPRQDNWQEHFQLDNAEFRSLTDKARVTVQLLQLNRGDRIEEHRLWIAAGLMQLPQ